MELYLPLWIQRYDDPGNEDDPEHIYNQFMLSFIEDGYGTYLWSKEGILEFWDEVIGDDSVFTGTPEQEDTNRLFIKIRGMINENIDHFVEKGLLKKFILRTH